jgi:hypothetical protein
LVSLTGVLDSFILDEEAKRRLGEVTKKKSKRLARLLRFFTENLEKKMKTNRAQEDDIKTQTVD